MPYEFVAKSSRVIERTLTNLGAEGKSIHELTSSLEDTLPDNLIKKIRYFASVRNKLFHESGFELSDEQFASFKKNASELIALLTEIEQRFIEDKTEFSLMLCQHCKEPTRPVLVAPKGIVTHSQCCHCLKPLKEFQSWSGSVGRSNSGQVWWGRMRRWGISYLKIFAFFYFILVTLVMVKG
ncbi:hypothetical protein [Vibrio astriarenae]|uniref:hypothetical protein n=1 Tax=Vibrio astriarenae TaxID=1481923 RepID=UPI003735D5BB